LGTLVTERNDIPNKNKNALNSDIYYYSPQNVLSSRTVSMKKYKTVILPDVVYGYETWSLILREEHRLRMSE